MMRVDITLMYFDECPGWQNAETNLHVVSMLWEDAPEPFCLRQSSSEPAPDMRLTARSR